MLSLLKQSNLRCYESPQPLSENFNATNVISNQTWDNIQMRMGKNNDLLEEDC